MALIEFKDLPDKTTPLSAENLNSLQDLILQAVFPIGSTYTTQKSTENPSSKLGFGTWELNEGKVIVGASKTDTDFAVGKTGGVKEIELRATAGAYDEDIYRFAYKKAGAINKIEHNMCGFQEMGSIYSGDIGNMNHNIPVLDVAQKTEKTKIMQPYKVSGFIWIRIA